MNEKVLVDYLNSKTNGKLTSIEEAKTGREICYVLVFLTGKPKYTQGITMGKTISESATNFNLAKMMIMNELNRPFTYTIAKLVEGDKEELMKLTQELKNTDEQGMKSDDENDGKSSLDDFLNQLEADLQKGWENCLEFRDYLDEIAKMRDNLLEKLEYTYNFAANSKVEGKGIILTVLTSTPVDFSPEGADPPKA